MTRHLLILAGLGGLLIAATLAFFTPPSHADSVAHLRAGDDVALMQEFADALDYASDKYGIAMVTVTTQLLPESTVAQTLPNGDIIVNSRWSRDPVGFAASRRYDVSLGYHPSGCSAAWATALHEFAHVLDSARGMAARIQTAAIYGSGAGLHGQLSGYSFDGSSLNYGEALAEAFQSVECNGAAATPAEKALYAILVTA